ncbi:MAG: peptide ABC transporter substrate-binding protein [Steroidobacteraceae bacterium]|nr:peptide ABC transporter substrate-binding protein [Steroidobacteraceae bacterium]
MSVRDASDRDEPPVGSGAALCAFRARRRALAALAAFALAACGAGPGGGGSGPGGDVGASRSAAADAGPAAAGATLRRGNGPEPDSLDPHLARADSSANVLRDVYEGLTVLDRAGNPAPGVAERWEVSPDGLTYTFHLRADARWSNGEPVTAQDFVDSWRRLVTPATGAQYAKLLAPVEGAADVVAGRAPPTTLGASAPDSRTFVVRLRAPTPYFAAIAAHWSTMPTYGARAPGRPGEAVSNGAFVLTEWVVGSHVGVRRNPAYWNAAAVRLDAVRFVHLPDANDEYRAYRAGELDVTYVLPQQPLDKLRAAHGAELVTGPQLGVMYYGFDLTKPPFRDAQAVRQALSMTVDRERLVRQITLLGEPPAYSWVPVGTAGHDSQQPAWSQLPYAARVEAARGLYAAAGYGPANPLRFQLRFPTGATNERVALAVASMWKSALGVEVQLVPEEFKSLLQSINRRDAPMFRASWIADYNDPSTFLDLLQSQFGINLPKYANPAYDAELAAAALESDPARRRARLAAAERMLLEDVPVIPLYFFVNKHLVSPRVQGWYDNPTNVVYSRELALR